LLALETDWTHDRVRVALRSVLAKDVEQAAEVDAPSIAATARAMALVPGPAAVEAAAEPRSRWLSLVPAGL
jgi:hypothetical protein